MPTNTRKKNSKKNQSDATATEQHTVVTRFQREIPIDEIENRIEDETDPDTEAVSPSDLVDDDEELDDTERFLRANGVGTDSNIWTMVVERLPYFERDARFDVKANRKSCGVRPFGPDFEEDIRREFARPGFSNYFRVIIKKNGRFETVWPYVIALEPPPAEVIEREDAAKIPIAQLQPAAPVAGPFNFNKQVLDYLKGVMEIQRLMTPTHPAAPAPAPVVVSAGQVERDDEDTALLSLFKLSPDLRERLQNKLTNSLLNGGKAAKDDELSTSDIFKLALLNGPAIIQQIISGIAVLKGQAPAPMAEHQAAPLPGAGMDLLAGMVSFAQLGMSADSVCDWLIDKSQTDDGAARFVDSLAVMDAQTVMNMMVQSAKPDQSLFIQSEQMRQFVTEVIAYLNEPAEEGEENEQSG